MNEINEAHLFYQLTPGKILDAVELCGRRSTGRLIQLNSMENRVYMVECENPGTPEEQYLVAKFYRPGRWSREQILEEQAFLFELAKEEVPVVTPLCFPDGETLKKIPDTPIYFSVSPRKIGRLEDELKNDQLEVLGRFVARLHIVGARSDFSFRPSLSVDYMGWQNLEFLLREKVIPLSLESKLESVMRALLSEISKRCLSFKAFRIHGDLHCGNILWLQSNCFLVDFDDCITGPAIQDLWLILPGRDEYSQKSREVLLNAYSTLRNFDDAELTMTESLRTLRNIAFLAWIARRRDDPYFKRIFPDFLTERYWQEQLVTFHEQMDII